MPWTSGNLQDNPEWQAYRRRVEALERRLLEISRATASNTTMNATTAKRFRIAVKDVGFSIGVPVSVSVVWSTPLAVDAYNIDVSCSALLGMPTVTVTAQDRNGCTVQFTPTVLATNATVVVLAVAPATTS